MLRRAGLFTAFCSAAVTLTAQLNSDTSASTSEKTAQYFFDKLGLESGLPGPYVGVVLQTRDAYLWVGTQSGLARYDGARFVNFRNSNTPAFITNSIVTLHEDSSGQLWIGTDRGLLRHRQGHFEHIGLASANITSLASDASGRIWIGTNRDGLFSYYDGKIEPQPSADTVAGSESVACVFVDSQKRVWVSFREATGIYQVESTGYKKLEAPDDPPVFGSVVRAIAESPRGTLWFATYNHGLVRYRGAEFTRYLLPGDGSLTAQLTDVKALRDGSLVVVNPRTRSVQILRDAEKATIESIGGRFTETLSVVTEDQEGTIWIAAREDGLIRARAKPFRLLSRQEGLAADSVRSVAFDAEGNLWAALGGAPVTKLTPDGKAVPLTLPAGGNSEARLVYAARDGTVWLAVAGRLYHYKNGAAAPVTEGNGFFNSTAGVSGIFEDKQGTMWIGTGARGLLFYKDGKGGIVPTPAGQPIKQASQFCEGPDGALYVGTWSMGLFKIVDGRVVESYNPTTGLPSEEIRSVYVDARERLWVGLRNRGLAVLENGKWLTSNALADAVSGQVSAIVPDQFGKIWFGTATGLLYSSEADLLAVLRGERSTPNLRILGASDHAHSTPMHSGGNPTTWVLPDKTIAFATQRGVLLVDPRHTPRNETPPLVHVERIVFDGRSAKLDNEVLAPAGTRHIEIAYTAPSFVHANRVMFKYKLEGYDVDWIEAETRRNAFYTHLPPGDYAFQVRACNSDGVWNEAGASVKFTVAPLFYQSLWFQLLAGLAVVGGGFHLYRRRVRRFRSDALKLQRENAELERRVKERTAELAQSYETLRVSEYFYHSLVESLPQIIVRKDADSRFTYANSAFAEVIGRPLDQIIGKTDRDLYPAQLAERYKSEDLRIMQTRKPIEYEAVIEKNGAKRYLHVKKVPLYGNTNDPIGVLVLFWDMTVFRETEDQLRQAQKDLIEASRLAGMAEVATGVLHNIGNALNSVNVSANVVAERVNGIKLPSIGRVAQLLVEQGDRLVEFFATDPRGKQLPAYLTSLGEHLQADRERANQEIKALCNGIDHIKEIVAAQQSYTQVSGLDETVPASELIESALRLNEASLTRHGVTVIRDYAPVPPLTLQRQKALQILINLIRNAKESLDESGRIEKCLTIRIELTDTGHVQISLSDNGIGIAQENLVKIFNFGFTTKKSGHGFGLHGSALTAKELGGSLIAKSDGAGKGATFILEFPTSSPASAAPAAPRTQSTATDSSTHRS